MTNATDTTRSYVVEEIRRQPLAQCPICSGLRRDLPRRGWTCHHEHAYVTPRNGPTLGGAVASTVARMLREDSGND